MEVELEGGGGNKVVGRIATRQLEVLCTECDVEDHGRFVDRESITSALQQQTPHFRSTVQAQYDAVFELIEGT